MSSAIEGKIYCRVAMNKLNGGGGDRVDIYGGVVDMSDIKTSLILIHDISCLNYQSHDINLLCWLRLTLASSFG